MPIGPNAIDAVVLGALSLTGLSLLLLHAFRRHDPARGAFGGFCLALLGLRLLSRSHLDPDLILRLDPIASAATVPLLMLYVQSLFPRKWFQGMTAFTWAYVIPYAVILAVYPNEQLHPIIPVMEKFSWLSLMATLLVAVQVRQEQEPGSTLLLIGLGFLTFGFWPHELAPLSLLPFIVSQLWLLVRWRNKAGPTRP
ncbi:7TM diverse intracellular signaling domain-containing protein [Oligoflexus tunisiensis]|uniref:7TM diverse intracellular signaling domain-containing protein n=1 Tax=Oligoflexus tunisiensis TaxID=708132 RepID=UPI00114CB9C0|nr:7TM diverse intracellular signaling domain-containing protein [Oligoflexus tunisiensis]